MRLMFSSRAIWLSFSRSPGLYFPDRMPALRILTTWARKVVGAIDAATVSGTPGSRFSMIASYGKA